MSPLKGTKLKKMRGFDRGKSADLFRRKQAEIDAAREMNALRRLDSLSRRYSFRKIGE